MKLSASLFSLLFSSAILGQPATLYHANGFNYKDLCETKVGEVWAATTTGLVYFGQDHNDIKHYFDGNNQPLFAFDLVRTRGKNIWAAAATALVHFDSLIGQWQVLTAANGLPSNLFPISNIEISKSGKLWLTSFQDSIYSYDGTQFINEGKLVPDFDVFDENVYAIENNGFTKKLELYSNGHWSAIPSPLDSGQFGILQSIHVDTKGNIWVTYSGRDISVAVYKNSSWTKFTEVIHDNSISILGKKAYGITFNGTLIEFSEQGTFDTITKLAALSEIGEIKFIRKGEKGLLMACEANPYASFFIYKLYPNLLKQSQAPPIENSRLQAVFNPSGDLFNSTQEDDWGQFKYLGKSMAFAANLWFRVIKGADTVVSAQSYRYGQSDYYSGPVANAYDSNFVARYNHVFTVSKAQIEHHKRASRSFTYQMPFGIAMWPAQGNIANGEASELAPFVDVNSNGIYDPRKGDYPKIKGDEAAYFIFNDLRGPKTRTNSPNAGLEVHCLAYVYDTVETSISDALFLDYTFINRANEKIDGLRTAFWADLDVGNPFDDAIGSDSALGAFYAYNFDGDDEGPLGYGENPPLIGGIFLSHPMLGFHYHDESSAVSLPYPTNSPKSRKEFLHFFNFRWRDGTPLILDNPSGPLNNSNGKGHRFGGSGQKTNWAFNDQNSWYQGSRSINELGGLSFADMGSLKSGESTCFQMALAITRKPGFRGLSVFMPLDSLKGQLKALRQFYEDDPQNCNGPVLSLKESTVSKTNQVIYPNPVNAGQSLYIEASATLSEIQLFDISGQLLLKTTAEDKNVILTIPANLKRGIYLVYVKSMSGDVSVSKIALH